MPLTKQQADTVANSLLAAARGSPDDEPIKPVPFVYRSAASRRLDPREEWLAYKQVTSRPLNRDPVFVDVTSYHR